jgi:chemotaxis protein methyltransferase CheR
MGLTAYSNLEMTDADFKKFSNLVYDLCGINLHDGKKELVKARLGKRIRIGQFESFREYYQYVVQDQSGQELAHLLDSISTNFTSFFREQKHFDYLQKDFLPNWIARKKMGERTLRFWSAGCSSGEEPYSLLIVLLEAIENVQSWDLKILASDISNKVLQSAAAGIYPKERIHSLPPALVRKYFLKGERRWQNYVKVKDSFRSYISFQRINLMDPIHFPEPFDCIFCRNVMIYFDKKTQAGLVNRFYDHLTKGGLFFIGHSESLAGISHRFQYVRPAIYQKEI